MKVSGAVAMADNPEHAFGDGVFKGGLMSVKFDADPFEPDIGRVAKAIQNEWELRDELCGTDWDRIAAVAIRAYLAP